MPDPTASTDTTSTATESATTTATAAVTKPGDTTQAKPGETASASASTGTDATKGTSEAAAQGEKKDAEPAKADGEKDTTKTEGEKPKDEAAAFEIKLPDGFVKDEAVLGEFQGLAKELGLKGEDAQKLVDLHVKMQEGFIAQVQKEQAELTAEWRKQVESDTATYGKQPYEAIVSVATRAMERYGSPALREVLNSTGLGNHPELIKFVFNIGKSMREDSVAGTSGTGAGTRQRTAEDVLRERYPSMHKAQT